MGELINLQQNVDLSVGTGNGQTIMSSREISNVTGKEHRNVKRDIKLMLESLEKDVLIYERNYKDTLNRLQTEYLLDEELTFTLVAGYNVKLRNQIVKRWKELEKQGKPKMVQMTQMEMIAYIATETAEQQKRITEVVQTQALLEDKFEQLKESTQILPKRPTNAEGITFIRARMNKLYRLPPRVVNEVLYSSPYAPKPAGQVRNTHEQAGNATYTVWYTSDVSKLFTRFVEECEFVTKTQAVHPDIDGRFKLIIGP